MGYPKKATHISIDYSISVKKVDASNPSTGLSGATFRLESVTDSGFTPKTGTTNASGSYNFKGLDAGTYTVTETAAPSGYQIDNPSPVYVTLPEGDGTVVTKTFTDTPTVTVSGTIRKVDRDNPSRGLAGATIAVQGIDNAFYGEYQTGAGGALEGLDWNQLLPGNYRAWEVAAPEGYTLDASDVKTFRVSTLQPEVRLVFQDDSKVKVRLLKTDNSSHPLPGAVFNVLKDGRIIATEATDSAGQILVTGVTEGLYTFVEVSAPEGYAKLDEPVSVHVDQADIDGGGTITVTAADKRLPNLTIQKRDAATGAAVPGTVFEVRGIGNGYHEEVTTGSNGDAVLTGIPTGSYEVTEKSVPAPYVLGEDRTQTVWLDGGTQRTLVFTNQRKPTLNLLKTDALSGAAVPGTVFTVQGIGNSYRSDWTTGTDGTASETLEPGTYRVTEKSVPAPYYLPENAADREQTVSLSAGDNKQLVFRDYRTPEVIIYKADAVTGAPLAGVTFSITDSRGGVVDYVQGASAEGTYVTDAEGKIVLNGLEPGTYLVRETATLSGYVLDETVHTVNLRSGETATITAVNHKKPTLIVYKYDRATRQPLAGTEFTVTPADPGDTVDNEGLTAAVYRTDESGAFVLTDLTPAVYTVTEVNPPDDYALDADPQNAVLRAGTTRTLSFYNTHLTSLTILKRDSVTHAPLAGAQFRVVDVNGDPVGPTNGLYTTGADGTVTITDITPDTTLLVTEVSAPEGYIQNPTPQTFTVRAKE